MIIYPDKTFYVIGKLASSGGFDFNIGLDKDFALKAYNKELSPKMYEKLNNNAERIIKDLREESDYIKTPYKFVIDKDKNLTTLLRWCRVPGNGCDLGIRGFEVDLFRENRFNSKMLIYEPHNIDNKTQAYSLLAIWITWADSAFALTRKEQQFF